MQVVMNNCFLLNPKKKFGTDTSCVFEEKTQKSLNSDAHQFYKMTSPSFIIIRA